MIFGWYVSKPCFAFTQSGLFDAENMSAAQDKLRAALGFSADKLIFKIAPGVLVNPDFMQFGHLIAAGSEEVIGFLYVAVIGDATISDKGVNTYSGRN